MTDSYSSSTNDSSPVLVESLGLLEFFDVCFRSSSAVYVYVTFSFMHLLLMLPLSTLVLCWGYRQRTQQHSLVSVMSHFDFYTYNMAVIELIGTVGAVLHIFSTFLDHMEMMLCGIFVFTFTWGAEMVLPVMICLDRFQAVVFPLAYLKLKQAGGIRVRNISTALSWLICCAGMFTIFPMIKYPEANIIPACATMVFVVLVSVCSLSVLYVLIRPPPGVGGVNRVQIDRLKNQESRQRKAFKTIVIIMGVLLFKFAGNVACYVAIFSVKLDKSVYCLVRALQPYFNLPSSLVLPLLFLHRKGKLPGCRKTPEPG